MTINPLDFDEHSRNKISSFGENSAQVTTEKFRATQTIDAANQTLRSSSYPQKMGITETNFNALQDKVRNLGVGPNGQQLSGVTYNQDRLIASIGIVKEVLISNMQLREDLLNVTQEHDETIQQNFQLVVENEDLRDRLALLGQRNSSYIEHIPYQNVFDFEGLMKTVDSKQALSSAKNIILSNIFSLRKQNRALNRRIKNQEERLKDRKQQRQQKLIDNENYEIVETLNPDQSDDSFREYPDLITSPKVVQKQQQRKTVSKAFVSSQSANESQVRSQTGKVEEVSMLATSPDIREQKALQVIEPILQQEDFDLSSANQAKRQIQQQLKQLEVENERNQTDRRQQRLAMSRKHKNEMGHNLSMPPRPMVNTSVNLNMTQQVGKSPDSSVVNVTKSQRFYNKQRHETNGSPLPGVSSFNEALDRENSSREDPRLYHNVTSPLAQQSISRSLQIERQGMVSTLTKRPSKSKGLLQENTKSQTRKKQKKVYQLPNLQTNQSFSQQADLAKKQSDLPRPPHHQVVLSQQIKTNDLIPQGTMNGFSVASTPTLEQQQRLMASRIANQAANGMLSSRQEAQIPIKNAQKESASKLNHYKKRINTPSDIVQQNHSKASQERTQKQGIQRDLSRHSSDNRHSPEKGLQNSPSKADYPMTLKPHLKTRFIRDKPVKPSANPDQGTYTIRTITEQEESSNMYQLTGTDNLPSEIHHSVQMSHPNETLVTEQSQDNRQTSTEKKQKGIKKQKSMSAKKLSNGI